MIREKSGDEGCLMNKYEMCDSLDLSRATYYRMNQSKIRLKRKSNVHQENFQNRKRRKYYQF